MTQFRYLPQLNAAFYSQQLAARIHEPLYPDCGGCTGCLQPFAALASSTVGLPCKDAQSGATMACMSEGCAASGRPQYTPSYSRAQGSCRSGQCMYGFPQRDSSAKARQAMDWTPSRAPSGR